MDYKKHNPDFVNSNSNYMRKSNAQTGNYYKNYNNNHYNNNFYSHDNFNRKGIDDSVSKPMFTNSKLQNNGNPSGNYLKIDIVTEEKKYKLEPIGEIPLNNIKINNEINKDDNNDNKTKDSLNLIKSLLIGGEKIEEIQSKTIETDCNINDNKKIPDFGPDSWRNGGFSTKDKSYKKGMFYTKSFKGSKRDNKYFNNDNGKNYYKGYRLNQPQAKGGNKFDMGNKNG